MKKPQVLDMLESYTYTSLLLGIQVEKVIVVADNAYNELLMDLSAKAMFSETEYKGVKICGIRYDGPTSSFVVIGSNCLASNLRNSISEAVPRCGKNDDVK